MYFSLIFSIIYFFYVGFVICTNTTKKIKNLFCLAPLFFISAFRYQVGIDFNSYVNYYFDVIAGNDTYMGASFSWIARFGHFLGFNQQLLFIIYSFLFILFIYLSINEIFKKITYSNEMLYLIIILFYSFLFYMSLNQIRSSLSSSIILYAILSEKRIKSICFVLLAVFFHSGSIIALPFVLFYKKINQKLLIISFISVIVISFSGLLSHILITAIELFGGRFLVYVNSSYFSPKVGFEALYTTCVLCVLFLITTYFSFSIKDSRYDIFIKIIYFYLIIKAISIDVLIFGRLGDMLKPMVVFSIVVLFIAYIDLIKKIKNIHQLIFGFFILLSFTISILNTVLGSNIITNEAGNNFSYDYKFNFCIIGEVCPK